MHLHRFLVALLHRQQPLVHEHLAALCPRVRRKVLCEVAIALAVRARHALLHQYALLVLVRVDDERPRVVLQLAGLGPDVLGHHIAHRLLVDVAVETRAQVNWRQLRVEQAAVAMRLLVDDRLDGGQRIVLHLLAERLIGAAVHRRRIESRWPDVPVRVIGEDEVGCQGWRGCNENVTFIYVISFRGLMMI